MLVFRTGSVIRFPSCLMDEIPWWPVFLCLSELVIVD